MSALIEIRAVTKIYRRGGERIEVLHGVDLDIPRGDFLALMGPSGSGKTTLLNLIGGLDTPTAGSITVDGQRIDQLSSGQLSAWRAANVGFVFQFYNLLPVLSAVENVEMPLLVSGVPAKEARERAMAALDLVHLVDWAGHRPAQLSGGQRQRVTIARALVNEPAIVWADEPTGDLDSKNADEIMDLITGLNQRNGQTFVVVTHDLHIAQRTFRIVNMLDGQIVDETVTDYGKTNGIAAGTR
jgi:putative ABC transport system ATP-binding protein